MPKNTPASSARGDSVLRMREDGWKRECARLNLAGDTPIAAHIGLPMPTFWRVRTHKVEPSTKFIKAAMHAFPGSRFEDLFEMVPVKSVKRAA